LFVGGKAAVGSIKVHHTPRIILSPRSSWKPVVEHDHANGEERQSHLFKLANAARPASYHTRTPLAIAADASGRCAGSGDRLQHAWALGRRCLATDHR
jgi:hypothetical protein